MLKFILVSAQIGEKRRLNMKLGKKLFAAVMALAIVFCAVGVFGNVNTAEAGSNPVKLYSSEATFCKYGFVYYDVYVQVDANSAANKQVYVHHTTYDQGWVDTAASYVGKINNNTEIWKASVRVTGDVEYVIKYVGDGATYWDNNYGKNYSSANTLGAANVKALPLRPSYTDYKLQVAVKNISYSKDVKVVYTTDNWATTKVAKLSYDYSDVDSNVDFFSINLDVDNTTGFEFCVSYTVNGVTYWDNNFGANYDSSFYRAY